MNSSGSTKRRIKEITNIWINSKSIDLSLSQQVSSCSRRLNFNNSDLSQIRKVKISREPIVREILNVGQIIGYEWTQVNVGAETREFRLENHSSNWVIKEG